LPYLILNNPPGNLPTAPDSVHTPSGPLPRHTGHTRVPLSKHHLSWYVIRIRLSVRWHTLWCSRLVIRVEDVTKRLTPVIRGVFTGYTTSLFYLPKVGLRQRNHSMPTNTDKSDPTKNRLLAALPREEYERILPHLGHVSLKLGEVVYESGGQMEHIYFPTTAIISLLYLMENGASAEMGMAGNEGVVGVALFMGGNTMPNRAVVQSGGSAVRMRAKILRDEFARGDAFQRLLLRYTQALLTQMSQTAVCNRLHAIEQQLCRWLLLSHDRLDSDELVMTQELIANMLGVRREGVTAAAGRLQEQGLISYVRGRIKILDRPGLEASVCECYKVVKDEYDRLLG
jgi:CRP-like cAMP-binding protein